MLAIGDPDSFVQSGRVRYAAILFSGLPATTSAVVYHDLRVAKEGIGIEELTSVFR